MTLWIIIALLAVLVLSTELGQGLAMLALWIAFVLAGLAAIGGAIFAVFVALA